MFAVAWFFLCWRKMFRSESTLFYVLTLRHWDMSHCLWGDSFNRFTNSFSSKYLKLIFSMTTSSNISYILAKAPTPKKCIINFWKSFGIAKERPSKCGGTTLCDFSKYRVAYLLLFLCTQSAVTKSFIIKLYILWFGSSSVKRMIKN